MLISFLLLFGNIVLFFRLQKRTVKWVYVYICASALWVLVLFAMTEILSAFCLLCFPAVASGWVYVDLVLCGLLFWQYRKGKSFSARDDILLVGRQIKSTILCKGQGCIPIMICIAAAALLVLSVVTTPYNTDSMAYHLPRIAHWAQNGTVSHYAASDVRQIANPVLAEFINLHVYILMGKSDILFNLLQTFSHLVCTVMVYQISRRLAVQSKYAMIAALLYFSTPVALAEALTTQTDDFAAVWLLYYLYILLDFAQKDVKLAFNRENVEKVCLLGLLVSLGYSAKPSVCIGMLVFLGWIFVICLARKDPFLTMGKLVLCAVPAVALPLMPEALRMMKTFGTLAPPIMSSNLLVATLDPRYLMVNFAENIAANMSTQLIYYSGWIATQIVDKFAAVLHVPNDFFLNESPNYFCDTATNPLLVYTVMLSLVMAVICWWRQGRHPFTYSYPAAAVLCCILFFTVMKWDQTATRYTVPYLAMLCPVVACTLQKMSERRFVQNMAVIVTFLCAAELAGQGIYHLRYALRGHERPYGYFEAWADPEADILSFGDYVIENDYKQIGLVTGIVCEYPIWYILKDQAARIEHVLAVEAAEVYLDKTYIPDCIFWQGMPKEPVSINGQEYQIGKTFENYCALIRADQ